MRLRKLLNIKTLSLVIFVIIFLIGIIFFVDLAPKIYRQKDAKSTPNTTEGIGETQGAQTISEAQLREDNSEHSDRSAPTDSENLPPVAPAVAQSQVNAEPASSNKEKNSNNPSRCVTDKLSFKTVEETVSWLQANEIKVVAEGRNGYIKKCSPDSKGNVPADVVVQPVNRLIYKGSPDKNDGLGGLPLIGRLFE